MNNEIKINFDELAKLAEEDPEAFERKRLAMINDVIQQSPNELKRRMNGLQWQIDQVRDSSANPMSACIRISKMMWDCVLDENGLLEKLEILQSGSGSQRGIDKQTADIISIKPSDKT